MNYSADGSLAGFSGNPRGKSGPLNGTWTVDDSGKMCATYSMGGRRASNCAFVYNGGLDYCVCDSDADKSAPVLKRMLTR